MDVYKAYCILDVDTAVSFYRM